MPPVCLSVIVLYHKCNVTFKFRRIRRQFFKAKEILFLYATPKVLLKFCIFSSDVWHVGSKYSFIQSKFSNIWIKLSSLGHQCSLLLCSLVIAHKSSVVHMQYKKSKQFCVVEFKCLKVSVAAASIMTSLPLQRNLRYRCQM